MKMIVMLASLFFLTNALAGNYRFLNDTAISRFTTQDAELMQKNMYRALDYNADGKKSEWRNPKTGAWGYATPIKTMKSQGKLCRSLTIMNEADHLTGLATYTFCKVQGQWKAY